MINNPIRYLAAVSILAFLQACSPEKETEHPGPKPESGFSEQAVAPIDTRDSEARSLTAEETNRIEKRVMNQVNQEIAEGLSLRLWASEQLLGDPVAINLDYQGRLWAAITNRSNNSEFDIRRRPEWLEAAAAFQSLEERRNFLRTRLSSDRSEQNDWLPDRNKDGLSDWRDLAVVKEEVLLLEDTNGDGRADQSQLFLKDFHSEVTDVLGGIYYHNETDELFLGVAPHAWRVKDTSGDQRADTKQAISDGFGVHIGFSGHGMSGVTLGPDGRIYYSIGDIGATIEDIHGNRYDFPNQGVIVRSELDGKGLEVFARGLRNTHEFVFDHYGNLIAVDNDGDHEGEYERLVYLIDGSDSGWRSNWQLGKYEDPKNNTYKVWMDESYFKTRFANQAAHLLPPIAPYHTGPAGMAYNPGTALNDRWKEHFFVAQFGGTDSRSGVNAFTLKPKGASFELDSDRIVLRGAQITGLDFGPDGALYMADWIEGWLTNGQGRVWKMDVTADTDRDLRQSTAQLLRSDFARLTTPKLLEHLESPDMRLRQRAQFHLVHKNAAQALGSVAAGSANQLARIHAIWGLGQVARQHQEAPAVPHLLHLLTDPDPEIRAQTLRVLGDLAYAPARARIRERLEDESLRVRLFATQALGRIGNPADQPAIIALLEENRDREVYLRHAGAVALARIGDEPTLSALSSHASEAVRIAAVVALGRLQSPALARFLDDSSQYVVANVARAIGDDRFVSEALPALATLLDTHSFEGEDNEPLLRRAINANLYVGGEAAAERLLGFSLHPEAPVQLRAEALYTLSAWTGSSQFDRVTGRYRGRVSHPASEISTSLGTRAKPLLSDPSPLVRQASIRALASLGIETATPLLVEVLTQDSEASVRQSALEALFDLGFDAMGQVALTAVQDLDTQVRMAALRLLPKLTLPVEQVVEIHRLLLQKGSFREQQAAYRSLAEIDHASAHQLLEEALQKLQDGKLAKAIQLDVIEAAEASGKPSLLTRLHSYRAANRTDGPQALRPELLYGGDPQAGAELFYSNSSAQCIRCHRLGEAGSNVGPNLTYVGQLLDREQLLEALVAPDARVPPGFGRIEVTTRDGRRIGGHFEAETENHLIIIDSSKRHQIVKDTVTEKRFSGSGMPPMGEVLSPAQLRDLVAFLASLPAEQTGESH